MIYKSYVKSVKNIHVKKIKVKYDTFKRYNTSNVEVKVCHNKKILKVFRENSTRNFKPNTYREYMCDISVNEGEFYICVSSSDATENNKVKVLDIMVEYENRAIKYQKGLISVIIPCYNDFKHLDSCIKSILKQSYNNIDIIVVNDGNNDTKEIIDLINSYSLEKHIKFINNVINKGASSARNSGAESAKGEYLFFCDADVILTTHCLMLMIQKLQENKNVGWCYCNYFLGDKRKHFWEFDKETLYKKNCSSTMSLIRRRAFVCFDETLKRYQDWDLFIRIMENGHDGVWIDKTLFEASDKKNGITNNSISDKEARKILHNKNNKISLK